MPALVRAAHRQDKAGEEPLTHPHRDHSRDSHTEKLCDLYPVCSYRGHKGWPQEHCRRNNGAGDDGGDGDDVGHLT